MPTTLADILNALDDLLVERFRASAGSDATAPFLAFEVGTPIPDETFRMPADSPTYSPAVALEYMSHHANTVPHVHDALFERTGKTIDGLYEIMLRGASPVDPGAMDLMGHVKAEATAAFESTLGSVVAAGDTFRPAHANPVDWYDRSAAANWTRVSIDRSNQPAAPAGAPPPVRLINPRLLAWQPALPDVRPMLSQPVSVRMLNNIAALRATPVTFHTFHTAAAAGSVAAAPPPLARPTQFAFVHGFINAGALAGAAAAPAPAPAATAPPVTSDGFSISVDTCMVSLRRPWFSDSLLNLRDWFVPSFAKGAFSAGGGAGDPGIFPVLPIACVLIRNLTIKAQWSDQDRQNIENSTHLASFGLFGRTFDQTTATLTVPGMQSVAWICDPLAVLPPCDAPPA